MSKLRGSFQIGPGSTAVESTTLILVSGLATSGQMTVDVKSISKEGHKLCLKCSNSNAVEIGPGGNGSVQGSGDFAVWVDSGLCASGDWEFA